MLGEGLPRDRSSLGQIFVARITKDEIISQESSLLCLP